MSYQLMQKKIVVKKEKNVMPIFYWNGISGIRPCKGSLFATCVR